MAKKLFVGGLPYSISEEELRDAFNQSGTVESMTIIMDRETGRPRGFGFIEMATDEEAQKAIEMWNGKEMGGRTLTVNVAKPPVQRPRRDFGGRDGGGYGGR